MATSIMGISPYFSQRFATGAGANTAHHPSGSLPLLSKRKAIEALQKRGGAVGLILLEIQDFYILTKIYGHDTALSLARTVELGLAALIEDRLQGLPLLHQEQVDADKFLLLIGSQESSLDVLQRTASLLRLNLQAKVRPEALDLTGQALEIGVGVRQLPSLGNGSLQQALHSAMSDAQRMARGNLDPAGSMLLEEFRTIISPDQPLVSAVYQPIVNLRGGGIFSWEALARGPAGSNFESPAMLFGFAEENELVFPLERACRAAAIRGFGGTEDGRKLFLNIHPRTLVDPSFSPGHTRKLLAEHGMAPHDVVLEITERHSTKDFSLFHRTLDHYRGDGYKVAIDDVGTGYSGLWSIAEIRPDFIKLDMSLIRGIDHNPVKRALIETFLTFSEKVGCALIAEGIETETELSSLVAMGVHYGQGYFLGRPSAPRQELAPEVLKHISGGMRRSMAENKCSAPIGGVVEEICHFSTTCTVGEVKHFLESHPDATSVAVVCDMRPVGLIMRHQMDRMLSSQYGLALYTNRPLTKIMDSQPLAVDFSTPVELVAKAAMGREAFKVYDHVLITREGRLTGMASVQKLLDALAQVQVEMAKGASPLTGLPGNVAIEREVERLVCSEAPVSFIYCDLDNFKVYNDSYGFKAGDEVILLTARILSWAVRRHGNFGDFIGHVGGDDFVISTHPERAERICRAVTRCFKRLIPYCYTEKDRGSGHIQGKDRSGRKRTFGLVAVSLAIVDCLGHCTLESISVRSAEMKKYAKAKPGNVWVRDRRGPVGLTAVCA